ncbi:MAG: hypothetical protein U1G08_18355 [Verrucomicrobiota bacterium]
MKMGVGNSLVLVLVLVLFALGRGEVQASWNDFVARQFPDAENFDPNMVLADTPWALTNGNTLVIRQTNAAVLRFPRGIYVVRNSRLVIEERPGGLEIMTPFIIVENGGELLAGGPESENRLQQPFTLTLTGEGNETSQDQGIDDPQLYSLYDLKGTEYVLSARQPGQPDPDEKESTLFGNKVLAAGPGGRIDLFGAKGTATPWARLGETIDVERGIQTNTIILDGNRRGEWMPGDRVAVSTSDFEPDHTEEATIQSVTLIQDSNRIRTVVGVHQIRNGVTGALTGGPDVWTDGPGTSFQWSHQGQRDGATGTDIRAVVALLTRTITVRSYRTPDAPRDALATRVVPVVDTLSSSYTPANGEPIQAGPQFSKQEYYPGKFGDRLSRTSNRRDIYGGHAMFRAGASVRLMGVEFNAMGQPGNFGRIGRYPVHFHLMKEATNSFVSGCSISDSFNRWVTVHGTFRLGLTNNVGYRSMGHGFYLEDGMEQQNVFEGNCGILARAPIPGEYDYRTDPQWLQYPNGSPPDAPKMVPQPFWNPHDVYPLTFLDRENPSIFWISNKQNYFRNNIAAGAAMGGRGYWLAGVKAEIRQGPGWRMIDADPDLKARYPYTSGAWAPMLEFYGNSASSCWNGFDSAFDTGGVFTYPVKGGAVRGNWDGSHPYAYDADQGADVGYMVSNTDPKVLVSPGVPPTGGEPDALDMMARTTAFRNRQYGAWLRPYWWWISNSQFSDNIIGATLVSGGNEEAVPAGFWGLINNSDFTGFSENLYRNQSRAQYQKPGEFPTRTDRNPSLAFTGSELERYAYAEIPPGAGRNRYAGGTPGATYTERRGYQFYDGPGPVLNGVSFHGFYPTLDVTYQSPFPIPNYSWTHQEWATNWFSSYLDTNNRFARSSAFMNAAIGWFGPGNQWKYSALTWTTNLLFDSSTAILRHMVHDPYTFAGDLLDGDRQTFIRDTDGTFQGYAGAGSVNNWPAHRGIDWVPECRSAYSCQASPYHYGNTDIIMAPEARGGGAILFGKVRQDFAAPTSTDIRDDSRYFISGFITGGVRLYGTLNAAGVRYTIQFRQDGGRGRSGREVPVAPPTQFAVRFTGLEDTPGKNSMGYAISFPKGVRGEDLKLTTALVHVSQGLEGQKATNLFVDAWNAVSNSPLRLNLVSTNPASIMLDSGSVLAWWDATNSRLMLTVTNTRPRSRKAFPLGLCMPESSQQTFIGRESVARWTAMVPRMEEPVPDDPYTRAPLSLETVFETVAKSLNDGPDAGGIIVGIQYALPENPKMPDAVDITPARLDDVYYDETAKNLSLNATFVPECECRLAANEGGTFGTFQAAYFSGDADGSPDADPDDDGLTNLEEYWSGSNPLAVQGGRHPVIPGIRTFDGTRFLTFTYRRPAGVRDLVFTVLSSEDLVHWSEDFASHEREVINNGDGSETVLVRTSRNVDAIPTRYVRLQVTLR